MEINNTDESKDLMKLIQMRFPRLSKTHCWIYIKKLW